MKALRHVTRLLVFASVGLIATVVAAATQATPQKTSAVRAVTRTPASATAATNQAPAPKPAPRARLTTPPLPNVGFPPVRPMDIVRATYDFAAQYPEILSYVPCYCGCGSQGHKANDACFIARRDQKGNVLEWDTHGFGCTICIDVAREAMQMYQSGADVRSIRAAIERKWTPGYGSGKTPTPLPPPAKKTSH
ncbi:MAG: hypothetical protein FJW22_14440 [Acidimicrobiia bacterium]|nr:hypothetical protein [Acidimicrobiia bacterium]